MKTKFQMRAEMLRLTGEKDRSFTEYNMGVLDTELFFLLNTVNLGLRKSEFLLESIRYDEEKIKNLEEKIKILKELQDSLKTARFRVQDVLYGNPDPTLE